MLYMPPPTGSVIRSLRLTASDLLGVTADHGERQLVIDDRQLFADERDRTQGHFEQANSAVPREAGHVTQADHGYHVSSILGPRRIRLCLDYQDYLYYNTKYILYQALDSICLKSATL